MLELNYFININMRKDKSKSTDVEDVKTQFVFEKKNYIFFFVGIALMGLGYLLMSGGGSDDPNVFNEDMFNFRRLTLAPIIILIGIALEFVAIFYKSKK